MDTSKEFIEMCKAAEEIQTVEMEKKYKHTALLNLYAKYTNSVLINPKEVWLPRQDQLQQIMKDNEPSKLGGAVMYINRLFFMTKEYGERFGKDQSCWMPRTIEQYWLVTVMKWSYNKEWNRIEKVWYEIN